MRSTQRARHPGPRPHGGPRLIVFDLDGTLIDSRRDLADSANALIVERGGRALPEERIARMVGEGARVLVRRALDAAALPFDDESVRRFLELYDERLFRTTRPYEGIPEVLRTIASGAVVAVLTNKPVAPARKLLDGLALSPFVASIIGGDGPHPRKPDPAALHALVAEHGGSVEQTVLVGDSRIDFETARAAGTGLCLVRYGFGFEGIPLASLHAGEGLADTPAKIPSEIERILDFRRSRG